MFICGVGGGLTSDKTNVKGPKFIILSINQSAKHVFVTAFEEREDVFQVHGISNAGYTCLIDMKELALSFEDNDNISFELGVLSGNKLHYNTLAALPILDLISKHDSFRIWKTLYNASKTWFIYLGKRLFRLIY